MLVLTLALAAATPPPERGAWEDCMLSYAQTESLGGKTAARIALEAQAACAPERQAYAKALIRQFQATASPGNSAINQTVVQIESDRKDYVRRVIAFVVRNRQA